MIPSARNDPRVYWEKVEGGVWLERQLPGYHLRIVVQPCRAGYVHAVTPDDLFELTRAFPPADLGEIGFFVLRQATRKEDVLSPCWGRMAYFSEIGRWEGPAVFLEAQPTTFRHTRPASMSPSEQVELDRLRDDGHRVSLDGRRHVVQSDLDATRATQLYRTLPHEIGHYVQYVQQVDAVAGDDWEEHDRRRDFHFARPAQEREDFAHRYADELRTRMFDGGTWPFARQGDDDERLTAQGLDPAWFRVPEPSG